MSATEYVTIQMIADHAKKAELTVRRALQAAQVTTEKTKGVRGIRIRRSIANKFLGRQWPEVGHLPESPL